MVLEVGLVHINVVLVRTLGPFSTGPSLPKFARHLLAHGSGASIRGFVGRTRWGGRWRVMILMLRLGRIVIGRDLPTLGSEASIGGFVGRS